MKNIYWIYNLNYSAIKSVISKPKKKNNTINCVNFNYNSLFKSFIFKKYKIKKIKINLSGKRNDFDQILITEAEKHLQSILFEIRKYLLNNFEHKINIKTFSTLNKTLKAYLLAIVGAEYILRWLPMGTHDCNNFVKPEELKVIAKKNGFIPKDLIGIKFNPITQTWKKSSDTSVNYISTLIKN